MDAAKLKMSLPYNLFYVLANTFLKTIFVTFYFIEAKFIVRA